MVQTKKSVYVYGVNALGITLYDRLHADGLIGWKDTQSTLAVLENPAIITLDDKPLDTIATDTYNGIGDTIARVPDLSMLILLTSRIDGIFDFFEDFVATIKNIDELEHGIKSSTFVICSNGILAPYFYDRLLRIIDLCPIIQKKQLFDVLRARIIFGATYQSSSRDAGYAFSSGNKGYIILEGADQSSREAARDALQDRQYEAKIGNNFDRNYTKNLATIQHGILGIIFGQYCTSATQDPLTVGELALPSSIADTKVSNLDLFQQELHATKIRITSAYVDIVSKFDGISLSQSSIESLVSSIDRTAIDAGLSHHLHSYVRYFNYAATHNRPLGDEIGLLEQLDLLASRDTALQKDRQVLAWLKEQLSQAYSLASAPQAIKDSKNHVVGLSGRTDFDTLEQIFSRAADLCTVGAKIAFVGSTLYLGKGVAADQVSDIDYVIYGIQSTNDTDTLFWLDTCYERIDEQLSDVGHITKIEGASLFNTPYIARLELTYAAKRHYDLHLPQVYKHELDYLRSFYLDSIVIWRWFTDKSNAAKIDHTFSAQYPAKSVKRCLGILYRLQGIADLKIHYLEIRRQFLSYVPCEQTLQYIDDTGLLSVVAEYMSALETDMGLTEEALAIFTSPEPGVAARRFVKQHLDKVDQTIVNTYPELVADVVTD
jgi:hypothetical protein